MPVKPRSRQKIDYQKSLRDVAKTMVRLNRPERLLKLITRLIDRQLRLTHTSLLVFEQGRDRFIFADSKGNRRFPISLVKFDSDHPLILWFKQHHQKPLTDDYLHKPLLNKWLSRRSLRPLFQKTTTDLQGITRAMDNFNTELVVPGYFKKNLLGLLLLGRKLDGRVFTSSEINFFQVLAQDCTMAIKTSEYHQNIIEQNKTLTKQLDEINRLRQKEQATYYEIMRSLAQEVYQKDAYTFGHVSHVERLGVMTAQEMGLDLSGRKKDNLSAGLILHDVGKIGIPDHILNKRGPLDPDEWKIMRTHVEKGANILEPLSDFREVAEIIRCHHENFDGSGYPRGLREDQIPIESRIVSVVDAFHAIVSTRCYSKGRPVEVAFEELRRCAGTQFDPEVVEGFIQGLKKEMKKRGVGFFLDESDRKNLESQTDKSKSSKKTT